MFTKTKTVAKILSVTDQLDLKVLIRQMFRDLDGSFFLKEATNEQEAIKCALEMNPDIVLMDLGLHNESGVVAARQIRHCVPGCKIIMMTMYRCDCCPIGV